VICVPALAFCVLRSGATKDQMSADTKDLNNEKSGKAAAEEGKATAEGDLATTVAELKDATASLATSNGDCMTTAADHEATVAARNEELKVIATAKKILKKSLDGFVKDFQFSY
jgi:hypothetical protein